MNLKTYSVFQTEYTITLSRSLKKLEFMCAFDTFRILEQNEEMWL